MGFGRRLHTVAPAGEGQGLRKRHRGPQLVARVTSLQLMPNRQNEDDVFCRKPAIFGDVSVTTPREHKLTTAFFSRPAEQRMFGQEFEGPSDTRQLLSCSSRILCSDEIEQTLEVDQCSLSYFDDRQERALGRRALVPDTRAVR